MRKFQVLVMCGCSIGNVSWRQIKLSTRISNVPMEDGCCMMSPGSLHSGVRAGLPASGHADVIERHEDVADAMASPSSSCMPMPIPVPAHATLDAASRTPAQVDVAATTQRASSRQEPSHACQCQRPSPVSSIVSTSQIRGYIRQYTTANRTCLDPRAHTRSVNLISIRHVSCNEVARPPLWCVKAWRMRVRDAKRGTKALPVPQQGSYRVQEWGAAMTKPTADRGLTRPRHALQTGRSRSTQRSARRQMAGAAANYGSSLDGHGITSELNLLPQTLRRGHEPCH